MPSCAARDETGLVKPIFFKSYEIVKSPNLTPTKKITKQFLLASNKKSFLSKSPQKEAETFFFASRNICWRRSSSKGFSQSSSISQYAQEKFLLEKSSKIRGVNCRASQPPLTL